MWNADDKLSYILSSSIQIFIFSEDSLTLGIGSEISSLCCQYSVSDWAQLYWGHSGGVGGKGSLSSQFSLAALCKGIAGCCQNWLYGKKSWGWLSLLFQSHLSLISLGLPMIPPHFWESAVYCPNKLAPLLGPLSTFPLIHQNMLSLFFESKEIEEKQNLFSVAVTVSLKTLEIKLPSQR